MKNILERYPFFLVLLPAFVVIHLEKELHQVISYRFVIDRILIFFAVPLLLYTIIYFLNRSVKKSAFAAFILSIPFFYLGDLKNWLSSMLPGSLWQSYSFLLTALFLVSVLSISFVLKSESEFRKQFLLINTGLLLFITTDLALIAYSFNKGKYHLVNEIETENKPCDNCEKPDIYYIVLDTYTSGKILKSNFNYPNDITEDDLKK
ncbi:MAG TPA: hypothetical protein VI548_02880, partial [Chitinophagaceae bacterium]|nr:hypothetical protein [Chitinophagaceae bacterium]